VTSLRREPRAAAIVAMVPALGRLDRLIIQAGGQLTLAQVLLGMALSGAVCGALLLLMIAPATALLIAAGVGIGAPLLALNHARGRRLIRVEEQLPRALDLLAAAVRGGHPVNAALALVGSRTPDPLGAELGLVVDEVTLGRPLDCALERLNARVDLPDLHALTIALRIRQPTGADLARTLEALARLARSHPAASFSAKT
jgi:tight adherence protein B